MNDVHETNYDDHGPPPRVMPRHVYKYSTDEWITYEAPEPTTWQDIVMRVLIGVAAVAGLLLIGGTSG